MTSPQLEPIVDSLPTPPASSVAPSVRGPPLPRPRRHPLHPGGPKEAALINYLDNALLNINKRVTNRHVSKPLGGELEGYRHSFAHVAKDIDALVDVVWVSGSPNIQLPYLISMAFTTTDYLLQFPPSPGPTLDLFYKFDSALCALLTGRDPETNDPLPGYTNNRSVSTTDKVRLKGVVEHARTTVAKVLAGAGRERASDVEASKSGTESEDDRFVKFEGFENNDDDDDEDEERSISGVFERTLMELGDVLGGEPIGIITDVMEDVRRRTQIELSADDLYKDARSNERRA